MNFSLHDAPLPPVVAANVHVQARIPGMLNALRGALIYCSIQLYYHLYLLLSSHVNRTVRTPTPLSCPTAPSSAGASTLPRGVERALPCTGSEWEGDRSTRRPVFNVHMPLQYFYHAGLSKHGSYSAQRPRCGTAHSLLPAGRRFCPDTTCEVGS